jgi:hypothetical protein
MLFVVLIYWVQPGTQEQGQLISQLAFVVNDCSIIKYCGSLTTVVFKHCRAINADVVRSRYHL